MVPAEVIDERIEVRGGEAVTERVLMTGADRSSPRSWTVRPRPCRCRPCGCARCRSAAFGCLRARDFDTFRRGFAAWPGPGAQRGLRRRRRPHRLPAGGTAAEATARPRHAAPARLAGGRRLGGRARAVRRDAVPPRPGHRLRGQCQQPPRRRRRRPVSRHGLDGRLPPGAHRRGAGPASRLGCRRLRGPAARRDQRPLARCAAWCWSCRSAIRTGRWRSPCCAGGTGRSPSTRRPHQSLPCGWPRWRAASPRPRLRPSGTRSATASARSCRSPPSTPDRWRRPRSACATAGRLVRARLARRSGRCAGVGHAPAADRARP